MLLDTAMMAERELFHSKRTTLGIRKHAGNLYNK